MATDSARLPLPVAPGTAIAWMLRKSAIVRMLPPGDRVVHTDAEGAPRDEGLVRVQTDRGLFSEMTALRYRNVTDTGFVLASERGTGTWRANVTASPTDDGGGCLLTDAVTIEGARDRDVARHLAARRRRIAFDLGCLAAAPADEPMTVAISGASGLVGSALARFLRAAGHGVRRLVRREARTSDEVEWDPEAGTVDTDALAGIDALVHLSGENIARHWTAARKARFRASRVDTTRLLATTLAGLDPQPQVMISCSAVGAYGNRGDERLDETASLGDTYLANLCKEWEAAADPAREAGIRVVHPRLGLVVSAAGGALPKLLPVFRLGLGGPIGNGRQYWPWVALDDALGAIQHILKSPDMSGPVNVTAPEPTTCREFTKGIGKALRRPAFLPVPGFVVRLIFGEMGDQALLQGQRAIPQALIDAGYRHGFTDIVDAVHFETGR